MPFPMHDFTVLSGLHPGDYPSRKVAVAMSGGVDSSLAAILLKEAGFDVIGLTMKLWDFDHSGGRGHERGCCDLSTFNDARSVAAQAEIPHYTFNMREEMERIVIGNFISEYCAGRTPNPCVLCNTAIKWHTLRTKAHAIGYDLLATGHYARIARYTDGTYSLLTGMDRAKDQSYFLWGLDSPNLASTLFPLGHFTKEKTRREALSRNLKTAGRTESQEICFIPDNDYARFLRSAVKGELPDSLTEGDILDTSGAVIGRHRGAAYYTVGQRRGMGIALGHPVYVTAVNANTNTITIGESEDLLSCSMTVSGLNWIRGFPPGKAFGCETRIRYRHKGSPAEVRLTPDGAEVTFASPQRAITPGQSAVFYDGEIVLGGGIIDTVVQRSA
ncbi:tRNA 2-thiouridine(34) synthase MnmA [bacterium]|nr:tRNA 2-thiouridine(34) synthase MnmA [bacterium]